MLLWHYVTATQVGSLFFFVPDSVPDFYQGEYQKGTVNVLNTLQELFKSQPHLLGRVDGLQSFGLP